MAIDRTNTLKAAQKYLAKGQLDKAIVEYEKLVKEDPKDARTLLKLGDIYTRKGAAREAAATYRKVAEQYAAQGFFLKAVAVYKQILKLDPNQLEAWEQLAEMYESLSLVSDALATWDQVAEAFRNAGNDGRMIHALGRIAALDVENVAATIKHAEALSKSKRVTEAVEAFERGAELLKKQGRIDDYIKVAERLLFHKGDRVDVILDLARVYLQKRSAKQALAHLQTAFAADAKHVPTLELLAEAFLAIEQGPKAVAVYKELARLHAASGRDAERRVTLERVLELAPTDAAARQELESMGPERAATLSEPPEVDVAITEDSVAAPEPSPPAAAPLAGETTEQTVARLMSECQVFMRYGLTAKVKKQLQQVLQLDPEHLGAHLKLKEVCLKEGDDTGAVRHLVAMADSLVEKDRTAALAHLQEAAGLQPDNSEVRERLGALEAMAADAGESSESDDDVIFLDDDQGSDEAEVEVGASSDDADDEPEMALEDDDDEPLLALGDELEPDEDAPELELDADDDEPGMTLEDDDGEGPELVLDADDEDEDEQDVHQAPTVERSRPAPERASFVPALPSRPAAPPTATPARSVPAKPPAPIELDAADDEDLPEEVADALEEAGFYMAQGEYEEARQTLDDALEATPDHPSLLEKLFELEALIEQGGAPPGDDDDQSFAMAEKLAASTPGGGGAAAQDSDGTDVQSVISQFKKGVEKNVDKGDTATHYDLGIAYMEMGLHNEAIEAFAMCLSNPDKVCTAHTMIGMSHVAKGDMEPAIVHFKKALDVPSVSEAEELDLWFEIGNASELLGKHSEALVYYEKVEERNPQHRNVAERIERLGVSKSSNQEEAEFDEMFDNMILKE